MTDNYTPVNLVQQVQSDYMDYSMAVLIGRAIPDLYDGMKPAQRRVLQTMLEEGLQPDKRYVKCARVTGLTMAYYHPHGGCYGTLVNLATPWNNNVPWIDGHGNFGSSVDGPAAERYTECKLRPSAVDLLLQDRATWETRDNYDGSRQEAARFNAAVPSVLLNGDAGIAVGFATRLAPHSLRSVVEATKLACKANAKPADLAKARETLIPDFPTGCDIVRDEQLQTYGETGSGSVRCRARVEASVQKRAGRAKDREVLTFTNLPPATNPEKIGEQVKDALEKGRFDGVAEVIDESDLTGDRVTIVAKPGVDSGLLARELYAYTDLDTKYSAKTLVIDGLKPVELSPIEVCQRWFGWRMERLEIQFQHELDLKEARLEIVLGFLKAIDKIDTVIKVIRAAQTPKEAVIELVSNRALKFTSAQARAILEMRLRQLTNLDADELISENAELDQRISELKVLIGDKAARTDFCFTQMGDLAKRHGQARRSQVVDPPDALETGRQPGQKRAAAPSKPRFVKVDSKKGLVTQEKGPRGAMVLDRAEKLVLMTEDGTLRKVPSNFKGPVSTDYSPVALAKRESEVTERSYLSIFVLEGKLKALVISGEDLCRANSKGKKWMPEGAEFHYFGEGSYTVPWVSPRKKKVELFPVNVRKGRPGAKGQVVASVEEVRLGAG